MSDIIKTQRSLAVKATHNPTHQFDHLYRVICQEEWIRSALDAVLSHKGARTAGIDGIYPKGIPAGVILRADKGQDLFKSITVKPLVDFGTIEEVIVLHTRKIPNDVARYAP